MLNNFYRVDKNKKKIIARHYEGKKYIERTFNIDKVLGEGASCIVYLVKYSEDGIYEHTGVLKEFNPISERINVDNFLRGYSMQCKFSSSIYGGRNITSKLEGIYEDENNKKYILMEADDGISYSDLEEESLYKAIKTIIAISNAVNVYHKAGYLHLDIKPENILILNETREIVKLFDFDSVHKKEEIENTILSYSREWAAHELLCSEKNYKISYGTDIYSIGLILFKKIMGRFPKIREKNIYSKVEFDKEKAIFNNLSPKVLDKLNEFFRKTIVLNINDRFKTIDEMVIFLKDILKLAREENKNIIDIRWSKAPNLVGRENEIIELHNRLEKDNFIFIKGVGGIGKTELAKMYLDKYKNTYKIVQFIQFQENLKITIGKDLKISNFNEEDYIKNNELDIEKLFYEKLKILKEENNDTILVIDNFNVDYDIDIDKLISNKSNGYKVIFTTRNEIEEFEDNFLNLDKMTEKDCLELYFKFKGKSKKSREDNLDIIKEILRTLGYNTLAIKLVALNCKNQRINSELILEKLKKCDIESIEGQINYNYSNSSSENKLLYEHLYKIFDISGLKKKQKLILRVLSLINTRKIDVRTFREWNNLENFDDINFLVKYGWVELDEYNDMISLHEVISTVIYNKLKPNDFECSYFIKSLNEILNSLTYESYNKRRLYIDFCEDIAKRLNVIGEDGADFLISLVKKIILNISNSDRKRNESYLYIAKEIYNKKYGMNGKKIGEVFILLLEVNIRLISSLDLFIENISGDLVWENIEKLKLKYLDIYKVNFGENSLELANAYLKLGRLYYDNIFGIGCFLEDKYNYYAKIIEENYIKATKILENLNDKEDILKSTYLEVERFYSDFTNPVRSDEKALIYKMKYEEIKEFSVDEFIEFGDMCYYDDNLEKAISYYEKALKIKGESLFSPVEIYFKIIRVYYEKHRYREIIEMIYMIRSLNIEMNFNDVGELLYCLGKCNLNIKSYTIAKDNFEEAIIYFRKSIKNKEVSKDYSIEYIIKSYMKLGNIEKLYENTKKYKDLYLLAENEFKNIEKNYIKGLYCNLGDIFLNKNNEKAYNYYFLELDNLRKEKIYDYDVSKAIEIFQKAIKIVNDNIYEKEKLYLMIGEICFNQKCYEAALNFYNTGMKISGKDSYITALYYKLIGDLYMEWDLKYCDEAKEMYKKCDFYIIALESIKEVESIKKYKVLKEAGYEYYSLGKYNEAIKAYEKERELINLYNIQSEKYKKLLKDNYNRCSKSFENLEELNNSIKFKIKELNVIESDNLNLENLEGYIQLGDLYIKIQNYLKAIDIYKLALKEYEKLKNIDKVVYTLDKIISIFKRVEDEESIKLYREKLEAILNYEIK